MLKRLAHFYQRYHRGSLDEMGVVWKTISQRFHQDLHDALLHDGKTSKLKSILNSAGQSTLLHGLEQHAIGWDSDQAKDFLHRLARLIGVLAVHNPEGCSPSSNWLCNDIPLLKRWVEEQLGITLSLPDHLGFDLNGSEPKITHRFFHYCAVAKSARNYLGHCPEDVLEIGAGLGNLGSILLRWGSHSYSIIDLPIVAVLSAYCLSLTCGSDKVWLMGEPERDDCFIKVFPSTSFERILNQNFDLVINMDSFPEMPNSVQDMYLAAITGVLKPDGLFLSVNHESDSFNQGRVFDAVRRNGGLRLVCRHPFMIRDGYIEEYYERKQNV